jgi:membrane-associated PAP2 superfamily phosphatase
MILRDWRALVLWPSVLMVLAFAVLVAGGFDRPVAQALFYGADRGWLGTGAGDWWAHDLIHSAGRWVVRGVALLALLSWALSFKVARLAPWRREALYVFAGIAAATALVGILKALTNVDCPWDISGFGGDRPYVTLFGDRPDYLPRAQCFPGAHSSSGFALVSLYFALRGRCLRAARWALALGVGVGVVFSIGQQARGAHFLSHDLASAALVWWVLLALYAWMLPQRQLQEESRQRIGGHSAREAAEDIARPAQPQTRGERTDQPRIEQ